MYSFLLWCCQSVIFITPCASCGSTTPKRGVARRGGLFWALAALAASAFLLSSDKVTAQTPTPLLSECPAEPIPNVIDLNAQYVALCGRCLKTPTPTSAVLTSATPTRTPSLTPSATLTPTQTSTPVYSPTPSSTADPSVFREFGNGYASFYMGQQDAAVGYITVFNFGSLAGLLGRQWDIVGFGWEIYSYSEDPIIAQLGITSPQAASVDPANWLAEVVNLEVSYTGCADAEIYTESFDDFCNLWLEEVAYREGFAYHEVGRFLPAEQSTSMGFAVFQTPEEGAPATPTQTAPNIDLYIRFHLLLRDRSFEFEGLPPTATPTAGGTAVPVCEVIEPLDVDVFDELYWSNIGSLDSPINPNNYATDTFDYPSGEVFITTDWGGFGLWGTAQNFWDGSQFASKVSTFPTIHSDGKVTSGGGILALGGAADLEGLRWTIDFDTEPQNGSHWAAVFSLLWGWDTVAGEWVAFPITLMNPVSSGTYAGDLFPQDVSYIFGLVQVQSFNNIQADFTLDIEVRHGGEWLGIGDELCLNPVATITPTTTPTLDPLGPTWTPTYTRTPIVTFTRTPTLTPTYSNDPNDANYCSRWDYRHTPTPTMSTPTPSVTLTPTLNATATQNSLNQTATIVGSGTATQNAGTALAGQTATAQGGTHSAEMTGTATIAPYHTSTAQTATAAPTATAAAQLTQTWIASTPGNDGLATQIARATSYQSTMGAATAAAQGTRSPSSDGNGFASEDEGGNGPNEYENCTGDCGSPSGGGESDDNGVDGSGGSGLGLGFNLNPIRGKCYTLLPSANLGAVSWPTVRACIQWVAFPHIEILGIVVPIELLLLPLAVSLLLRILKL